MSDLGELDRPGTPASPGPWDTRSGEWLAGDADAGEGDEGGGRGSAGDVDAASVTGGAGSDGAGEGDGGAVVVGGAGDGDAVVVDGPGAAEGDGGAVVIGGAEPAVAVEGDGRAAGSARYTSDAPPARRQPPAPRRASAVDPVKSLMHRHRDLCERAVDPLEIAAGLEAHGVTDRTASRFRHRDVFSLAEEMYARVPRGTESPAAAPPPSEAPRASAAWLLRTLLPGALCAATVAALHLTDGRPRLIAAAAGALAVALGLRAALARGPLGTPHPTEARTRALTCWLVLYALLGDGLLRAAVTGGPDALPTGAPDGPWPLVAAPVLALALSCAPAAWTAHLFATRARRKLALSRGLEDFTASVLPLLFAVFALFLCALTALLAVSGTVLSEPVPYAGTIALGALLFLSRLLTTHGFTHAPALVLTATAATELTAVAAVFAARLPGCGFLGAPVESLVGAWGPGSVPALACAAGAAALLFHATRRLTRASAHAPVDRSW
ncbi:hypothetical protein [Streptomyces sp. NPDC020489]|uniref:hypothetical protein n=1 Tax=Streptomyces sp. NPDC020489 TaxID=3365077 RepID=UPI0037BBD5AE